MAKGRVAERSQTGSLQSTPAGDRAAAPRGPTAPGSKDHLKGEWVPAPELGLDLRLEGAGRGSGGERTPAGFRGFVCWGSGACSLSLAREERERGAWVWAAAPHEAGHLVGEP